MTQLIDHIARVEQYGFVRRHFPMKFSGHNIQILSNDGHKTSDGRLLFDFCLHCKNCEMTSNISGRFPVNCDRQEAYVVNAKIAVFAKFSTNECKQN